MARLRLIHWNAVEARERTRLLREAGHVVGAAAPGPATLGQLKRNPPDAVIIDLSRLPAQGRDFALALREARATRHLPLVFAGGQPEKVARVKQLLPDAVYTSWSRMRVSLTRALRWPPARPVVPVSRMAGYAGTPLLTKLGVKPDAVVALVGAPPDFEKTLGRLPAGARLRRRAGPGADLTLWFPRNRRDLAARVKRMAQRVGRDGMWIVWAKQASGVATDLTQSEVRRTGLANGLVDYKICAIDTTWSGLKFTRRRS